MSAGVGCRGESVLSATGLVNERVLVAVDPPFPESGTLVWDKVIRAPDDLILAESDGWRNPENSPNPTSWGC